MVKSVDGGGGRGLRLVRHVGELREKVHTCVAELSSGRVFVEMAAVDGLGMSRCRLSGMGAERAG